MSDSPQRLTRTLTLGPLVLFGLAYMAPMIVLGTFGVLDKASNGTVPTAYLLALVAMLFTAISYGRMARAFPVAGSAYTYTRRTIDSRVGFLVGWAVLLDYFWLPTVIWLIGASYLSAEFPGVPTWLWIVAFIALTTILNILGLKLATNINLLLMAMQVLVLIFFIVLSFGHAASTAGAAGILSATPFGHPGQHALRHRRRGRDRRLFVPRIRRHHHPDRGNPRSRTYGPESHRAGHDHRRRDFRGGLVRDAARGEQRAHQGPELGRIRDRRGDWRPAFLRDFPRRSGDHPVRLRHRRAGQRLPAALRDGPRLGLAEEDFRVRQRTVPHPFDQHPADRRGRADRHFPGHLHGGIVHQLLRALSPHSRSSISA